jgi:hypothetical protein
MRKTQFNRAAAMLSKYRPLSTILCHDDFDRGQCGWIDLMNNFVLPGHKCRPSIVEKHSWGPVMLSNANFGYAGTHGAMDGVYSLKLATKGEANPYEMPPAPGGMSHAIKRLTASPFAGAGLVQLEIWFAYTPEQDRIGIGEKDIRAFGLMFDVQDAEFRYFIGARYLNSVNGEMKRRWQYAQAADVTDEQWTYDTKGDWCRRGVDPQWFGKRRGDGGTDGFRWIPDGDEVLCYNESDDKINWSYLRLTIDTCKREYVELQSGRNVYNLRGLRPTYVSPYKGITSLLNAYVWIEADTNRRVFFYVDSALISVE